jgi:UDP-GlcNAc:undecaprenyl-phosphate GlcNAc-1-phosphate transferase
MIPNRPEILFTLLLLMHWGIPQAFNLIDGANGLAIGFSLLLSLALAMLGQINYVLPGILLGLLALNWPKARLFLGDCGSLTLGLLFTILARQALPTIRPNGLLCLFAYPILDVTLVVLIRLSKGISPMTADRNHMHHHLLKILGKLAFLRVPILWVLAGSSMAITLANGIWNLIPWAGFTALLLLFIGIFIFRRSFDTEDPHSVTSNLDGILH